MAPKNNATDQTKRDYLRILHPWRRDADGNPSEYRLPIVKQTNADGTPVEDPQPVGISRVGTFPERVITGDYTKYSHPWLSAFVQSDWMGGGQIYDSQESTDISRYWTSTLESRFPNKATLLPLATKVSVPGSSGSCVMVGDLTRNGVTAFYASFGTSLYEQDGESVTLVDSLGGTPVRKGVQYRGTANSERMLWIPMGTGGYVALDPGGTPVVNAYTSIEPLNFCIWNNGLYAVDADGRIWQNTTGLDADWTSVMRVECEGDPRILVRYIENGGNPALFLVTTREVFAIDVSTGAAFETYMTFAPHTWAGYAAERFGEWLAVSHGIDTMRYDGSTMPWVGLARDDGMPAEFRGVVKDYAVGPQDLFTLVQGLSTPVSSTGFLENDTDGDLMLEASAARSCLMRYERLGGWHPVWASDTAGLDVTNCYVSAADGENRLYWGFNGSSYFIALPESGGQSPKQNPLAEFSVSGELIGPWMDFNNAGSRMTLASMEVRAADCTADETITVSYQVSGDPSWHVIGVIDDAPESAEAFKFRAGDTGYDLPNGQRYYTGTDFHRMRYKVSMRRGSDVRKSPVLESISITYMLRPDSTMKSATVPIDCSLPMGKKDGTLGNLGIHQLLDELVQSGWVAACWQGDDWRIMYMAGVGGPSSTGQHISGNREVTLLDVFDVEDVLALDDPT